MTAITEPTGPGSREVGELAVRLIGEDELRDPRDHEREEQAADEERDHRDGDDRPDVA